MTMSFFWELFDSKLFIIIILGCLASALAYTALRLFAVTVQQRLAQLAAEERATQIMEADHQLHQTLNALHAQVWYLDTEARVVNFNQFTEHFLGFKATQVRGLPMSAVLSQWNEPDETHERNLRVIKSGEAEYSTVESYYQDGYVHWVRVDRIPSFDANQRLDGLMLFIYDITPLKSTEQALRFQKTLLEAQTESSLDGIWVISPKFSCLSSNQNFIDMWQIPAELLTLGNCHPILDHIKQQLVDPTRFEEQIEQILASSDLEINDVLHLKDGRNVDWFSTSIVGDDDQDYGRAWYFRDMTETRKTEEALRESEIRNRTLIDNIPDMLFRVNKNGKFLDFHGMGGSSSMMEPEQFLGRYASEIFPPDIAETFLAQLQIALAENTVQIHHCEAPMLNDETRHWEQRMVVGNDEEILLIVRDITARKKAEAALREAHTQLEQHVQERTSELQTINEQLQLEVEERRRAEEARRASEERLELALHGADLGLIDIDLQTGKAVYNQRWAEIRGYQLNHFYDTLQSWLDSIHPDDRRSVAPRFKNHLRGQAPFFEEEYRIRTGDESWRWVRCRGRVVSRDQQNQPLRFSGTQMDITDYKQLEQQLLQSQKMEAVGRLAGGVAHDFNNILTVIVSYSELALRQLDSNNKHRLRVRLEEIRKAAERAARLTSQLLLFSRSETVKPMELNINQLVIDIEEMLEQLIGEQILLDIRLDPTLHSIIADPGQIEQILLNLIVNGRDAMAEGGTIEVSTRRVELADSSVLPHPDITPGSYVELMVRDDGCGMDRATQARIFEPFFTTKGRGKGTGLGLATVFGAVQQNHGYITVDSTPHLGTTFRVYFPAVSKDTLSIEDATALTDDLLHDTIDDAIYDPMGIETILLVEDEDHIRNLACSALQEAGYTVIPAANGEEALNLTTQHSGPIHLVVTDVVMPGMSGVKLSYKVTTLRPSTKVLYMSGYTDGELTTNLNGNGNGNYALLQKPFTPSLLASKVRDVLDH